VAKHFHQLKVNNIRPETDSCVSISFDIPTHLKDLFAFTQGQNITIRAMVEGEDLRRSYSICSSPFDNELRIAVKKVEGGKFSSWINNQLKTGDLLEVLPPTGKFYTALHSTNRKHYIAFAAGSGITPLLSIIKTTLAIEPDSHFTLFYGNKTRSSIIFREELEALKNIYMHRFAIHHILSRETAEFPLYQGRITEQKCELIFRQLMQVKDGQEFFLCGPEAMIFDTRRFLEKAGVDESTIHFELFTTPGQQPAAAERKQNAGTSSDNEKYSVVTIRSDGISFNINLSYSGASILDAALASGADLPFACKGGVCATCRAKLISGEVNMDNNYALEPEEVKNGYILTCQSHPRTEQLTVDYDQK
jgi:ring-1,2-phenylacetyl-CoA epoxidase subunit PaaE